MKQPLFKSFACAIQGLKTAFRTERNLRIHLGVAFLVLLVAIILDVDPLEMALLLFAIALVIVAELINTALEKAIDLKLTTYHPLAKVAKDVAAAAVLVAAITAVLIGLLVLGPYFWSLYKQGY